MGEHFVSNTNTDSMSCWQKANIGRGSADVPEVSLEMKAVDFDTKPLLFLLLFFEGCFGFLWASQAGFVWLKDLHARWFKHLVKS